ncbi:uncharacterized protein LTR77_002740 [Saxophila tyrrhenica]|uniref:Uncharacterized protein n=1 Tax=Saxophila tyrrhenica TaxID=1690608 RepID=A0AAV9PJW7_9PEZI|nr:hypothetical protein LTR77_002740 [Saxophila tyrrhenica]
MADDALTRQSQSVQPAWDWEEPRIADAAEAAALARVVTCWFAQLTPGSWLAAELSVIPEKLVWRTFQPPGLAISGDGLCGPEFTVAGSMGAVEGQEQMATPAPPPYRRETPPSEASLPAEATSNALQLSTGDISGLRAQILDNAHTLWVLHYTYWRPFPDNIHLITRKSRTPNKTEAVILSWQPGSSRPGAGVRTRGSFSIFVHGPEAESSEGALKALLTKMEGMIGARWDRYEFDMKNFIDK